jgi:hypothetical protein
VSHAPGPWEWKRDDDGSELVSVPLSGPWWKFWGDTAEEQAKKDRNLAPASPHVLSAGCCCCGDVNVNEDDARLIAAAPDLLAALQAWERWYAEDSTEHNRDTARDMGLAAIAKATG